MFDRALFLDIIIGVTYIHMFRQNTLDSYKIKLIACAVAGSFILDLIWLIEFSGAYWSATTPELMSESGLLSYIVFMSFILFLLKIVLGAIYL
jgi:hypothetical protein